MEDQLIAAGIIMLAGSVVQGAIGFALGMIAVPLLVDAGFSLSQAVALTTLSIGIQVLFGAWKLRAHIPWPDVKLAAAIRYAAAPLGILTLLIAEDLNSADIKPLVGIGLLIAVAIRIIPARKSKRNLPMPLSVFTFALSGFLQGLLAMGGPPLVLWMTTRDYSPRQARAFTMSLFLLNAPVQVLLLLFLSRSMHVDDLLIALIISPMIFLGTTIGLRLGNRFDKTLLNRLALAMLSLIALNAIS